MVSLVHGVFIRPGRFAACLVELAHSLELEYTLAVSDNFFNDFCDNCL